MAVVAKAKVNAVILVQFVFGGIFGIETAPQ
jgi:hypothetical protein